jgi:uncharacterized protein (TIGR00297 family)
MAGFALLLRWLTWPQAAALAAAALAFNAIVLPRIGGRRLYRDSDVARGLPLGILFYPFSVLLLIVLFPRRLDIVAAAWGIMAFGDGFATIVGRAAGRTPLRWNPDKTAEGSAAFVVAASLAAVALAWWTRPAVAPLPPLWFTLAAPIAAAVVAAFAETLPVRLDDNLSVPAAAAATLWMASLITVDPREMSYLPALAVAGLALNVAVAVAGWLARAVSASGAVAGAAIGAIIYVGAGWQGWALLFAAFLAASITSRLGIRRKIALGIAEERGGRRGAGNAIANTGVAACAAALAVLSPYSSVCLLALTASLVAGASDTVASEIGKAWGRETVSVVNLRRVPSGTPGGMSREGTLAGIVAATALAALAAAGGLIPVRVIWIIVLAATLGALVESLLGATLEPRGIVNNDLLNFINTAAAAGVALALAGGAR